MRKLFILLMLSLCLGNHAQELNGDWNGTLEAGAQSLTVVLHIDKDAQTVRMDVLEQGGGNVPMEVKHFSADSLHLTIAKMFVDYQGKLTDGQLKGVFKQGFTTLPLVLNPGEVTYNRPQEPLPPYPYKTEEVTFYNPSADVTLAGTLTYPVGYKKKVPVVLMVTGSGPENRDEELFMHKPFLVIADYLALHGIASLRYDDRGVGASTGVFSDATTADFAEDARAGIQYLRSKKQFRRVGILGHSEGGSIAFMLGSEGVPDFIVSLAGPAGRIDTMMVSQLNLIAHSQGMTRDLVKTTSDARKYLRMQSSGKWMDYFVDMDLTPYVRKTSCPVLALGGERDLNVPPSFNTKALEDNLPKNKRNVIKVYPELSHMFQHSPTGNPNLTLHIEETISPEVLSDIANWIHNMIR